MDPNPDPASKTDSKLILEECDPEFPFKEMLARLDNMTLPSGDASCDRASLGSVSDVSPRLDPASNETEEQAMSSNYEDYGHPERLYKGLMFTADGYIPPEVWTKQLHDSPGGIDRELCWVCGWNTYNQIASSYGSRVRIFHTRGTTGIWSIGNKWMLKDQLNDHTVGNDYITQQFLRNQPDLSIPLVKEMRLLNEPTDPVQYTLMSRAQGERLDLIYKTLSPEQKTNYKHQLVSCIKQLRQFTAPVPQKVDGSLLDDVLIGYCNRRRPGECKTMGRSTEEWWENISEELRGGLSVIHRTSDPKIIEEKLQELKDSFPKSEPYVLTHADLNRSNIIVKDGKISAIIDWESAGYYPWWVERYVNLSGGDCIQDMWKDIQPEMDHDTFCTEVLDKVDTLHYVFEKCPIEHPKRWAQWIRPGFCECQPYSGPFWAWLLAPRIEHIINPVQGT